MNDSPNRVDAVAACLAAAGAGALADLWDSVWRVLLEPGVERPPAGASESRPPPLPPDPDDTTFQRILAEPAMRARIDLVFGGATRVKEYVFEAPRLPEIRGASALLDYITNVRIPALWAEHVGGRFQEQLGLDPDLAAGYAQACVIYAGGGNILAVAPAGMGQQLAAEIEVLYADWTRTAQSVAVTAPAMLAELRYGRIRYDAAAGRARWLPEALAAWDDPELAPVAEAYFYQSTEAQTREQRFFRRKVFGELVTDLATRFYRRREEHGGERPGEEQLHHNRPRDIAFVPLIPHTQKCDSSDMRPAVWGGLIGDETAPRELSAASARKRFVGQAVKRDITAERDPTSWFHERFGWDRPAGVADWRAWQESGELPSWQTAWEGHLESHPESAYALALGGRQALPAQDMGEIGSAGRGYVGLIYADGNNVAQYMAVCRTPAEYAVQAAKLGQAARRAVLDALAARLRPFQLNTPRGRALIHPFEILTIGGDDLMVIVPGDRALETALSIGAAFERSMAGSEGTGRASDRYRGNAGAQAELPTTMPEVGLSAGVVIAQENSPIFFLRRLAEELQKRAKKLARQRRLDRQIDDRRGTVDFMVLKAITMVTDKLDSFRRLAYGDGEPRRLIARPYTWNELAGLIAVARALQEEQMPRSQLYRLREVLERSRDDASLIASTVEYLVTRSRMRSTLADTLKQRVELDWAGSGGPRTSAVPPWIRSTTGWETIWLDLAEIYDVLAREERHAQAAD